MAIASSRTNQSVAKKRGGLLIPKDFKSSIPQQFLFPSSFFLFSRKYCMAHIEALILSFVPSLTIRGSHGLHGVQDIGNGVTFQHPSDGPVPQTIGWYKSWYRAAVATPHLVLYSSSTQNLEMYMKPCSGSSYSANDTSLVRPRRGSMRAKPIRCISDE